MAWVVCAVTGVALLHLSSAAEARSMNFTERVARLHAWLIEHRGYVNPKVHAVEDALPASEAMEGNGRGLVAQEYISPGEELLFVPQHLLVSNSKAEASSLGEEVWRVLFEHGVQCMSCTSQDQACWPACQVPIAFTEVAVQEIALASWIAKELGSSASSSWQPWLDTLPSDFGGSLLKLTESQVRAALLSTELVDEVLEQQSAWRIAYEVLSNSSDVFRRHIPSYDRYEFARHVVLSRLHGLSGAWCAEWCSDSIVPFADLLNHDPFAPTSWGPKINDAGQEGFMLSAVKPIAAGSPITCSYGDDRPNTELFLRYGFVLPDNPAHAVVLPVALDIAPVDPLHGQKLDIAHDMGLHRAFKFSLSQGFASSGRSLRADLPLLDLSGSEHDELMFRELLAFLRIASLDSKYVEDDSVLRSALFEHDEVSRHKIRMRGAVVDARLERQAARRLAKACEDSLSRLGTQRSIAEILDTLNHADNCGSLTGPHVNEHLRSVATGSKLYLNLERRLFTTLHALAQGVERLVEERTWPNGIVEHDAGMYAASYVEKYAEMWKRSYLDGLTTMQEHKREL